jgi:hypothetical protein
MPVTLERATRQTRRRSIRVTGRKLASPAPLSVQPVSEQGHPDGMRSQVALMASDDNVRSLLDTPAHFCDSGEAGNRTRFSSVQPQRVQRLPCRENNGYPLRRTLLVVFNRDRHTVTAEFKEVTDILQIRGGGSDKTEALRDLERQFDRVVREKVRIPPHARDDRDELVRRVVNYLVDWEQFERENPAPRLLVGQVMKSGPLRPKVRWLYGPEGVQNTTAPLPREYASVYLSNLKPGDWFQAVVLEYPDRVEWLEPPTRCPDPTNAENRRAAWDRIPRIELEDPDAWPLKGN